MISEKRWNVFKLYLSIEEHLLIDEKPSIYLNEICFEEEFSKHPFVLIKIFRKAHNMSFFYIFFVKFP